LLLGTLATHAASEIQEGELPPLPAMAASLRSPNSQPLDWDAIRLFLEKDDSNKHAYKENDYDCKHFNLELYRRAQTNGIACRVALIQFAETRVGHSVVCFPTTDKGDIYIDFTPLMVQGRQIASKTVAMLVPGRARIQVPLEQIPSEFTNDIAFFDEYIEMQTQLQSAATLLSDSQTDLAQMQKKIEGIKQAPSISKWQQKELDHLEADYAEKYHRYQTARAVYISYEKQWKSPFDIKQTDTVVNLIRF
jgi:hypothetical protein